MTPMRESLVGKVLLHQSTACGYSSNDFCLILEDHGDTVLAVSLATERVLDFGPDGTERPQRLTDSSEAGDYVRFGEPFPLRIVDDSNGHVVARTGDGIYEKTYEFWNGEPQRWANYGW
jgi:hypothetical protein